MRRRILLGVCLVAALGLVGGCAGMDYTSVANIALKTAPKVAAASRPINDSEEYYVGRAVAARILSANRLYTDPQLTLYVNEVGETVARKSPMPNTYKGYHFAVLDTSEPNAFACPGGIIFVTKGLVLMCGNEDELAAVLAHEVAHVANKDGINSISKARWTEVLTTLGTETAKQYGGAGGQLVTLFEGSIDDVFKTIVVNGYSRGAEEAADAQAVKTLQKAGYDPAALEALLTKMASKSGGATGIYKTHPPTADRLAKLKSETPKGTPGKMEEVRTKRFQSIKM
ncbi:MAG: M48 family metallopeptidase [Syntrophales bacterium]|nr:M48 family metallopeptidase [Syntrophales bacterium]MDD5643307.1 M48 family metallopeptidase [Syntrophales bacterium]